MALIGLVRVSTDAQETQRQHDVLAPVCWRVFEEKVSGKLAVDERPGLTAALAELRPGDMLTVIEVDRLSRNLLEGLLTLNELFQRGVAVKILDGIAAGEHTQRSFLLDLALALAEDRRRDISRKTKDGLAAAERRGRKGGRPSKMTPDRMEQARRMRDERISYRRIGQALGVSEITIRRAMANAEPLAASLRLALMNT
ncbi:recombinase family protein [Paenarthrobacter ureafaciens]|uniref:recombinase family protein n=1 Tax=Paenarthrobacter ureafaciens TaxID=37931 RepID=UPI0009AEE8AC|nr:recombinase family protein [Paenarthrobacter ureafaciens]GLU61586.1 DNA invertase [Paenarthrobacter ureafaciens]GLU65835.1 DNA invertase [Paenarthrobacter ureafaciens]GLU70173.1 DNA invertase [Paenarthrobacter ureafaciens]GLU74391.1 DNA invertase [Paenarthrobacter ureafaciens]GLU78630.1 DNA invertase [Paenarthrobacter ureafaciens]